MGLPEANCKTSGPGVNRSAASRAVAGPSQPLNALACSCPPRARRARICLGCGASGDACFTLLFRLIIGSRGAPLGCLLGRGAGWETCPTLGEARSGVPNRQLRAWKGKDVSRGVSRSGEEFLQQPRQSARNRHTKRPQCYGTGTTLTLRGTGGLPLAMLSWRNGRMRRTL